MLIENLEREIKWYKQPEAEGKTLQKVAWHRELLRKQKKLTSVARASLEELLLDYEDCLRQHNLALWPQNRPEIQAIKKLFRLSNEPHLSYRSYLTRAEPAANMLISHIHQANYLLNKQLLSLEHLYIRNGGFTERLYTSRVKIELKIHK